MPRISAPMCLVSGATSKGAAPAGALRAAPETCVESDMSGLPVSIGSLRGDRHSRRGRRRSVSGFPARQRGKNPLDQSARGIGAELDRDTIAAALTFIGEVDGQHVIEGGMVRMVEIDIGGIDPHPALAALGAADESGFF